MPAEPELKGVQTPRLFTAPPVFQSSAAQEAVELAALAGLELFPWQQHVLDIGMRERADGKWSAFECCVNVPRQNGKGGIIEARELAGLFLLKEHLIVHSAHEFKTSRVAFQRIHSLIMGTPDLRKRVKRVLNNTTETSITLVTGQSLQFIARSGGSGRGWTGDLNILDEAMSLGDDAMGALMPTVSAVPNPQLWYLGSAGIGGPSVQLGRLRRRAQAALEAGIPDPSLAYFEWSVDPHVDECPSGCTDHDGTGDPVSWAKSNPSLGYLISHEYLRNACASMGGGIFEREHLGVGTYPSDEADTWQVIGEDAWRSLAAAESAPEGEVVFAIDATPEQDHAAIAVAGRWRGGTHIEIAHHQPGMSWVVAKAKRMQEEHKPRCWVVDAGGPAGSLIQELEEELGIKVVSPKMREVAMAAGQFFNAVADQSISHIDQPLLATALAGAQKRPLGDAWAWARRGGGVDISPLVAATNAKWGLGVEVEDDVDPLDNIF
ncbi:terminase [Streptomyces sp. NPDC059698]|uniref:terminase n=1 Tax=unclassified Streptomyces TaxID=2593676 RepID=UPI0009A0C441|nr:terminase [Streptomyces sp. CB02366]